MACWSVFGDGFGLEWLLWGSGLVREFFAGVFVEVGSLVTLMATVFGVWSLIVFEMWFRVGLVGLRLWATTVGLAVLRLGLVSMRVH